MYREDVTAALREQLASGPGYFDYYVCGDADLRAQVAAYLDEQGIPDSRLAFEPIDGEHAA